MSKKMDGKTLFFNGVDAATGRYHVPPVAAHLLSRELLKQPDRKEEVEELEERLEVLTREHLGPKEGVDARNLAESGWGVVFAEDTDPAAREALTVLVRHRQERASRIDGRRFREIIYRPGETRWDFLDRHEADFAGPADPDKVPYYLLLVGGPDSIPFDFQYDLDLEHAVGRIAFDTAEEYAAYAEAVLAAEEKEPDPSPQAVFFAVRNADDISTQQSHDFLVAPLAELFEREMDRDRGVWRIERRLGEEATKARLARLLGGEETPALLLSASHGVCYDRGDQRQRERQGALLCQDWPGPEAAAGRGLVEEDYFAAHDLDGTSRPAGLVVFHFGCYGAGTPERSAFPVDNPAPAAPFDFVARLPQRLLARGALAVVSHVDQCWAYSYLGFAGGERHEAFESTLRRLLRGHPVGSAMEYFNRRAANLSSAWNRDLEAVRRDGKRIADERLIRHWTACQDARSYLVLGDPAVRLRLSGEAAATPPASGRGGP